MNPITMRTSLPALMKYHSIICLSLALCYGQSQKWFQTPSPRLMKRRSTMSEFGERLIQLREKSKLSLREICQKVGIPPSRLIELERGVRIPTSGQIQHLENFYGINSGELAKLAESSAKVDGS